MAYIPINHNNYKHTYVSADTRLSPSVRMWVGSKRTLVKCVNILGYFFLYNISELISLKSFHFHVRSYKRGECECLFAAVQIEVKVLPVKKTYFHSYFVGFFLLVVVVVFFISRFLLFYISVIILSINTTLFIYKNKSLTLKYLFCLLFSFFCEDPSLKLWLGPDIISLGSEMKKNKY